MNADPLATLRPLHVPDALSWWPPAPGWWIVAAVCIIVMALLGRTVSHRLRTKRYRKTALRELEQLYLACTARNDAHAFAAGANRLLKRAALARYPRADVAALCDADWRNFLDRTAVRPLFASGAAAALTRAAYDPSSDCDSEQVYRACREWLRHHR
jgi:Domain of unknown function (DUF4381)